MAIYNSIDGGKKTTGFASGQAFGISAPASNFTAIVIDVLQTESQREEFFKDVSPSYDPSIYPLGTIKFRKNYTNVLTTSGFDLATPLNMHEQVGPRTGESVKVNLVESYFSQTEAGSPITVYKYDGLISHFNNLEHNIIPKETVFGKKQIIPSTQTYQQANIGIPSNTQQENVYDISDIGGIAQVPVLDHVVKQSRRGTLMRMGHTNGSDETPWKGPDGAPLFVLRNGQKTLPTGTNSTFEDINADGSSLYLLSEQTIDISVACTNFLTFGEEIQNVNKGAVIVPIAPTPVPNKPNAIADPAPKADPLPLSASVSYPVNQTTSSYTEDQETLPYSEDEIGESIDVTLDVPVTNGIINTTATDGGYEKYNYIDGMTTTTVVGNSYLFKSKKGDFKTLDFVSGKVSNIADMPKSIKAMLDVISYMEATMGAGDFNGYDIYYNFYKLKGYDSEDANPPHPNVVVSSGRFKSTAAGRYQFNYKTWAGLMGSSTGMSKKNQDLAAWRRMQENVSQQRLDALENGGLASFQNVVGGRNIPGPKNHGDPYSLAGIWASLPVTYGGDKGLKGYYGQNTYNKKSFTDLYTLYQKFLLKY